VSQLSRTFLVTVGIIWTCRATRRDHVFNIGNYLCPPVVLRSRTLRLGKRECRALRRPPVTTQPNVLPLLRLHREFTPVSMSGWRWRAGRFEYFPSLPQGLAISLSSNRSTCSPAGCGPDGTARRVRTIASIWRKRCLTCIRTHCGQAACRETRSRTGARHNRLTSERSPMARRCDSGARSATGGMPDNLLPIAENPRGLQAPWKGVAFVGKESVCVGRA
jgi:hypothetical protein